MDDEAILDHDEALPESNPVINRICGILQHRRRETLFGGCGLIGPVGGRISTTGQGEFGQT